MSKQQSCDLTDQALNKIWGLKMSHILTKNSALSLPKNHKHMPHSMTPPPTPLFSARLTICKYFQKNVNTLESCCGSRTAVVDLSPFCLLLRNPNVSLWDEALFLRDSSSPPPLLNKWLLKGDGCNKGITACLLRWGLVNISPWTNCLWAGLQVCTHDIYFNNTGKEYNKEDRQRSGPSHNFRDGICIKCLFLST